jgi:hypothetical protein
MAGHVTSLCSRCQSSSVRLELEAIQCFRTWVNFSNVLGVSRARKQYSNVKRYVPLFFLRKEFYVGDFCEKHSDTVFVETIEGGLK